MPAAHEQHPEHFDLPGDPRPRKIFRAVGTRLVSPKGTKKRYRDTEIYVNSPTLRIAERTGRNYLAKALRMKMVCCYEITWREYSEVLRKSGFTVSFPETKTPA